jgi:hypothetical protein
MLGYSGIVLTFSDYVSNNTKRCRVTDALKSAYCTAVTSFANQALKFGITIHRLETLEIIFCNYVKGSDNLNI